MSSPCGYLPNRLPDDLIAELQRQVNTSTGIWADYNTQYKKYLAMRDFYEALDKMICPLEVPERPDPDDYLE